MEQTRREIEESKNDIDSLKEEIALLESTYNTLLQEINSLDDEFIDVQNGDSTKENTDDSIPHILQHEHVVGPLNVYFSNNIGERNSEDELQIKRRKLDQLSKNTYRQNDSMEVKENILYENIYRLGGITAFPINDYLFKGEEELLGLRFDLMSHLHKKYLTPHYVILRKVTEIDKAECTYNRWSVYRHTLPVYVPLIEISKKLLPNSEIGIVDFTQDIRQFLLKIQYKHEKFDILAKFNFEEFGIKNDKNILRKIDKDLSCSKLILYVTNRKRGQAYHTIDIFCTDTSIQKAVINIINTTNNSNDDIHLCENMLRNCSMNDIIKTFRKVFKYLIHKSII